MSSPAWGAVVLWPSEVEGREISTWAGIFPSVNRTWALSDSDLDSGQLPAGLWPSGAALRWGKALRAGAFSCSACLLAPSGSQTLWPQVFADASSHILPATETTDTVCRPCPYGFFSNESSLSEKCHPWTRYKGHLSLTHSRVGPVSVSLATCCSVSDTP